MKISKQMSLESEKIEVIKLLAETKDMEMIKRVKGVMLESNPDWWDELTQEQEASIKLGLAQLKKGQGIPHEKVMKRYKK